MEEKIQIELCKILEIRKRVSSSKILKKVHFYLSKEPYRAFFPFETQAKIKDREVLCINQFTRLPGDKMCLGPESNRHGGFPPQDFKSCASTNFATQAGREVRSILKVQKFSTQDFSDGKYALCVHERTLEQRYLVLPDRFSLIG